MRIYTLQVPPDPGPPVLLPEGFSWGAFIFGPIYFLWHGLWISGILLFLLQFGLSSLVDHLGFPAIVAWLPSFGVSLLVGFSARDWWRMTLDRQGYSFAGVVAARSEDEAAWLLTERAFSENAPANSKA